MVHLRYGPHWQGLSDSVIRSICDNADRGIAGQILIVPEQVSFDTEWRLCAAGGDRINRFGEVLSFTRLADRVFSVTGGAAHRTLDQTGRLFAMAGALEQVRSRLKLYGRHGAKPEFLLQLLRLYDEFCSYGVTSAALTAAGSTLGGALAEKLEELSLIMESYAAVCAGAVQDPATRLDRLCDALAEGDYARGRQIFVDGFTDFTVQEERVLEQLARGGADLTVTLCMDDPRRGQSLFSVPRDTGRRLRALAERWSLGWEEQKLSDSQGETALTYLQSNLFLSGSLSWEGPAEELCLSQGENPCEEALNAVGEIQRLVRQGCRYRDIAVAYPEGGYRPVLENLFSQYQIPAYFSGTESVLKEPVIRCVLSALEAAAFGMETDPVMEYLRSGFAPVDRSTADLLENYALVWGLRGTLWEREFTLPPEGYRDDTGEEAVADRLAQLNKGREEALGPLIRLKNSLTRGENTGAQVLALARFTEELQLKAALEHRAETASDPKRAQEYAQLHELLLRVMEQLYGVLGETIRTPEEFWRLFRCALSQCTVGTIPAAVSCVHAGTYAAVRSLRPKHLLVLGAGEGSFPGAPAAGSLLTDRERRELIRAELPVAPDAAGQLERELLRLYLLLSAPSQTLLLSCPRDRESYLFDRGRKGFPQARQTAAAPWPVTALQAAALVSALPPAQRSQAAPELQQAAETLVQRGSWSFTPLSPQTVEALYGRTVRLSATSIDKYASCKLAFYLDFGLRLKELKPAGVDAPLFGTFVHDVLEHTVGDVMARGGFHTVSREETEALAEEHMQAFLREQLGDLEGRSQRAAFLLQRSLEEVRGIVRELWEELSVSEFRPERWEMEFHEVFPASRGNACLLRGKVDRVDLYRGAGGPAYLRVVDYKTGRKDFDLTDVLSGMGLQLLIYLFTLEERDLLGEKTKPAGVQYFPARIPIQSEKEKPTAQEAEKLRRDQFRRKGMLLNDPAILRAMEPTEAGKAPRFLDVKRGKIENLAAPEEFDRLKGFVQRTVAEMTDQIMSGTVAPNPYDRGPRNSACLYCPHAATCHVESGSVPKRRLAAVKWPEFLERLEREEEKAHGKI